MSDIHPIAERLRGSIPALVTPMKGGAVDEGALADLIEWHVAQGSHGIVPVGTTGESPTLSHEEHERVVSVAVEAAAGRIPVIAGAGSNNTAEGLRFMRHAAEAGADAALVVTPYYNKPSQRMLFEHFRAMHDAADLPIVIYNIPGRSVVDMSTETMTALAALPRIVGVKDATGDLARCAHQRAQCGPGFVQLSGEDATAVGFNAMGGVGCISVTANVAPAASAKMQEACLAGDYATALEWQDRLLPLHEAMFMEPSPGPAKAALSMLGRCEDELRAPIMPVQEATRNALRAALEHAGIGL